MLASQVEVAHCSMKVKLEPNLVLCGATVYTILTILILKLSFIHKFPLNGQKHIYYMTAFITKKIKHNKLEELENPRK
jgi:hypothetical protein